MVPVFGVSAECQSIGTIGKKQRAMARSRGLVIQPPKLSVGAYFELFIPRLWFPYSSFQQVRQPSITCPVEEDTSKIVWRSIMFNGSFLRVCRMLQFVKKNRFWLHESGWTRAWCPGLVSGPSAKAQELLARIRGLIIQPKKLSVGAYFELSFLGCGFLIHLSKRY